MVFASEVVPVSAEATETVVGASNAPGDGDTAPAEADTKAPSTFDDTAGSEESAQVAWSSDAQPAAGYALVDAGREGGPEKLVQFAEAQVGGDEEVPSAGPDAASEVNPCDATAPVETNIMTPAVSIDPTASLGSIKVPDGIQPAAGDELVESGPQTAAEPEQHCPAARRLPSLPR